MHGVSNIKHKGRLNASTEWPWKLKSVNTAVFVYIPVFASTTEGFVTTEVHVNTFAIYQYIKHERFVWTLW
jgi:hypothetical protein